MRREFPDAARLSAPAFQNWYWRQSRLGYGRSRPALTQLRVKTPKRVVMPLSIDEVTRFWYSFRSSRDLAVVGLMLLHGLRSCAVLALNRQDVQLSESQIRVPGKGKKLASFPSIAIPPNCSIATCVWNHLRTAVRLCSFLSKGPPAVTA
jgi:integrase